MATGSQKILIGRFEVCLDEVLGRGFYGDVYRGVDSSTGEPCAVKRIFKDEANPELGQSYKKEVEILSQCDHINVVKLLHHQEHKNCFYIMMRLCNQGSLETYVKKEEYIKVNDKLIMAHDASQGLLFLHNKKIIHRDLKPANMLIHCENDCLLLVLGDVGISRFLPRGKTNIPATMTAEKGTPEWIAPETSADNDDTTDQARYNKPADVYGLGMSLASIVTHQAGKKLEPLTGKDKINCNNIFISLCRLIFPGLLL